MNAHKFKCGRFNLSLEKPLVMGIINLSENSFSGDGIGNNPIDAIEKAFEFREQGASIIDIGAESSRPGSSKITAKEEWQLLQPVLDKLSGLNIPISVDTYKPEIMHNAINAGADIINDIYAFQYTGAFDVVKSSGVGLIIMHMQGEPNNMQHNPNYENVVAEIDSFFTKRREEAYANNIEKERLCFDPGFGFGKTLEHNTEIFKSLANFAAKFSPLLVGVSRKTMLGEITAKKTEKRVEASVAAAILACIRGAKIIRVHDVGETVDAIKVLNHLN